MIVLMIGYFVVALVFSLLAAALSALGDSATALSLLLVLPAMIWLGCRLFPMFAVVTVDKVRNPVKAITRSWRLTKGHAWTIFLASLVFVVILVVVCGLALVPSFGLIASMADPGGLADAETGVGPAIGSFALLMISMVVVSVLFRLLYSAFIAVVHGTLVSAAGEGVAVAFA
jgi:hypothetical protein